MADPQRNVRARLKEVRDEIDTLLEGGSAREAEGRSVGSLDDINGVVFGLAGSGTADVRATQEPVDEPPAPLIEILGEFLDGLAQGAEKPPRFIAERAVRMMELSKRTDEYNQWVSMWREDRG